MLWLWTAKDIIKYKIPLEVIQSTTFKSYIYIYSPLKIYKITYIFQDFKQYQVNYQLL